MLLDTSRPFLGCLRGTASSTLRRLSWDVQQRTRARRGRVSLVLGTLLLDARCVGRFALLASASPSCMASALRWLALSAWTATDDAWRSHCKRGPRSACCGCTHLNRAEGCVLAPAALTALHCYTAAGVPALCDLSWVRPRRQRVCIARALRVEGCATALLLQSHRAHPGGHPAALLAKPRRDLSLIGAKGGVQWLHCKRGARNARCGVHSVGGQRNRDLAPARSPPRIATPQAVSLHLLNCSRCV